MADAAYRFYRLSTEAGCWYNIILMNKLVLGVAESLVLAVLTAAGAAGVFPGVPSADKLTTLHALLVGSMFVIFGLIFCIGSFGLILSVCSYAAFKTMPDFMNAPPETRPEGRRLIPVLRAIGVAPVYGCSCAIAGWLLGYGLIILCEQVRHLRGEIHVGGFGDLIFYFYPWLGAYLGLFTGIAGRLMHHRRLTWWKRIGYGGMALGVFNLLISSTLLERFNAGPLLALLFGAYGLVAGAIISAAFGIAPAWRPTSPSGPGRYP